MDRIARIERKTRETSITVSLNLDGRGKSAVSTGIGFFDHMLTLFSRHGFFDLTIDCTGDIEVDFHHTVEDVGITIGTAFNQALGGKEGIARYGYAFVPMEYALARAVVDLSGRIAFDYRVPTEVDKVGEFDSELVQEFFKALADNLKMNLHIDLLKSSNAHHNFEAVFKAVARALSQAASPDPRVHGALSTKGTLE